jgi:hypothetical protein
MAAQNALWQQYRDDTAWAIQSAENALARSHQIGMLGMQIQANTDFYTMEQADQMYQQLGATVLNGVFGVITS